MGRSLQRQQLEMEQLQQRREKQQKLKDQQARKQELDRCLRLKMKRLAREQEEELQVDLSTLKQVLTQHTDEKLEAAQRKVDRLQIAVKTHKEPGKGQNTYIISCTLYRPRRTQRRHVCVCAWCSGGAG